MTQNINQEIIDELVERFYDKLTSDAYFTKLFAERGVDLENLKERQRGFLSKLVSVDAPKEDTERVNQSHSFQISEQGATAWLNTMEETIQEMDMDDEMKTTLIEKIRFLLNNLLKK